MDLDEQIESTPNVNAENETGVAAAPILIPPIVIPPVIANDEDTFESLHSLETESDEMHDAQEDSLDLALNWEVVEPQANNNGTGERVESPAEDMVAPIENDNEGDVSAGNDVEANDLNPLEENPLAILDEENDYDDFDLLASDVIFRDPSRIRFITGERLHETIRGLINQVRGNGDSNSENYLQHLRRAIFSLERNRQYGSNQNEDENDQDQIMDAEAHNQENAIISGEENGEGGENSERVDEPEEIPENAVRFDTNLPAEHSYLGENMDRVSGVNYLDAGQHYNMLLFVHERIILPGEVLPFMISNSVMESDMDSENGLLFGVCFPYLRGNNNEETIYGVTCQIYEKGTDNRGNMLIKSRALQRFVTKNSDISSPLQYIAAHPQHKCYGFVKILPEIYLPEPLACINMGSMNRFRDNTSMQQMYRRYQAATTSWPAHIYDYYSISAIVEKARTQLEQHKIDTMPTDPIQLSFWLVRNLHLSESMMKTIFMTDSVNIRMKLISSTFKKDSIFTCRYCGNRIANCSELFAMSKHGVQTQYCNSAGYIHETNTVYNLLFNAISYSGDPSSEFSWFPGYQWHIIVCKLCARHIGWEFKALEPNMVPKTFFGISSSSVRISSSLNPVTNPRNVIYRNLITLARTQRI